MKFETLQDLVYFIVGALYDTHKELGPGLNEYVYQEGLEVEFKHKLIHYEREKEFHPLYRGIELNATYRVDFVCYNKVIIECKAVKKIIPEHRAQLFNYMRLTKKEAGILVNFAPRYMEIERYFYNPEKNEMYTHDGKIFVIENE